MSNLKNTKRNLIIFTIFVFLCGWIGYLIDILMGQSNYGNMGTSIESGTLGALFWLVTPLLCTIILRSFMGDGWENSGFAINFKSNEKIYLISFLIYPTVTIIVILLGIITKGIRFSNMKIGVISYLGILSIQIFSQFIKNIFEESVWRGYLTNQLLKFNLSDIKLYFTIGFTWWFWHLPYIMIFLSESEIQSTLPVGRIVFFLIGLVVVSSWTVMYTEIFRMTKSIWPLVIAHTMEDAVINPLLLLGILTIEKNQAFLFSLSVGIIPTILYLLIGLSLRNMRIKRENEILN